MKKGHFSREISFLFDLIFFKLHNYERNKEIFIFIDRNINRKIIINFYFNSSISNMKL